MTPLNEYLYDFMTPPTSLILNGGTFEKLYFYDPPCIVKWGHFICNLLRANKNYIFMTRPISLILNEGDIGVFLFFMSFYDPPCYLRCTLPPSLSGCKSV